MGEGNKINFMKILILGFQGNLGTQLYKIFSADKNYDVIGVDKADIDLCNHLSLVEKIREINPEIIINAVAYNAVDKCEEYAGQFALANDLNGEAVGYLAQAALNVGAILVHYSTDYVFAGDKVEGYKETDVPGPINNYGKSKLLGETRILERTLDGLKYYIIRTSKLFGPKGVAENVKPSFFDVMLNLAKEREEISAVDEELSCFTYTLDLANKTKEIIETKKEYGIYHVVNSEPVTWYEAVRTLFTLKNINVKLKPVSGTEFPRPAKRPRYSVLLNTKLEPLRSYKEALKEYLG
jgi:dTDP-4-dehydrorhamnose reductase